MKIRTDREVLAEAVTWAARAIPSKPPVPVLAGLHLTAADGTLSFAAFDYETSARTTVPAEVADPGTVLVSGKLLADIVRSLPARPVDLWLDGTRLRLACGSFKSALLTMPVDEYPSLPVFPAGAGTVDGAVFAAAVAQVAVAASRDESLPVLTSVSVRATGTELVMSSTDRYRLAVRRIPWTATDPGLDVSVLVRARTLADIAKSVGSGDVTVGLADSLVAFAAGGRHSTSLLVDGQFPAVEKLFPAAYEGQAVVEVEPLIEAVRRVALVAEKNAPVELRFTEGQVALEAGQGEDAQAAEVTDATLTGVPGFDVRFNPVFLADALGALPGPYARLGFTVPGKPVVFTSQREADGDDDQEYRALLMPVRGQA